MIKYLVALFIVALGAGYMYYDLTHPADINKEISAIKADRTPLPSSWGEMIDDTTTIEKKESTKVVKPFTDRPPQEEEVQEQAKTTPQNDIPPVPPEEELDGGPTVSEEPVEPVEPVEPPTPPIQYGQYPCSYPDCPGNPDVEDYLAKRWRWEGGGVPWYGDRDLGGRSGVDVQTPFFRLHVRPWRGEWRRKWRRERLERRW